MKKRRLLICTVLMFMFAAAASFLAGSPAYAKTIKLNKTKAYLAPKQTVSLKVKGTGRKVTWKSSNKKVATVSRKGKVSAKKTGTVTITAKVGKKKLKCKIIVEKKERNNARKLRDFILKKGKKNEDRYGISYTWTDEENTVFTSTIYASKKNNILYFDYSAKPDTATADSLVQMNINLIAAKPGTVFWRSIDSADNSGYKANGTITTAYDGAKTGITLKKWFDIGPEEGELLYNDPADLKDKSISSYVNAAFEAYNKLLKNKKAGQTMKSIGFGSWK